MATTERLSALRALATHTSENSPRGARCAVMTPGGELQSDPEGGTDGSYHDGGGRVV